MTDGYYLLPDDRCDLKRATISTHDPLSGNATVRAFAWQRISHVKRLLLLGNSRWTNSLMRCI
jgi:hypothetical protein